MNLLFNTQNNLINNNNSSNIFFQAKAKKAVYKRTVQEIENYTNFSDGKFDGKSIEDRLCDMVGKCLGDKYLFQIVGSGRSSALWIAIRKNTSKAIDVILRILSSKESQGKTCEEIVDKMLAELKPPKVKTEETEVISLKGASKFEKKL